MKKLAGEAVATADWVTNVGNEDGQKLISVLTEKEGSGIQSMANGLVQRYASAKQDPPSVMYTDIYCCSSSDERTGEGSIKDIFAAWPNMTVKLDPWHWMRRLARGMTTDAHPLFGPFMSCFSACIFVWDDADLEFLKKAKKKEMEKKKKRVLSDKDVVKEMAHHCRRRTRPTAEIIEQIEKLINTFEGDKGKDTLGTPLIGEKMREIWEKQKKHVQCIQDPVGIKLYKEKDTIVKGGIQLPTYRRARGSTSLESFHLHLNRFVPGMLHPSIFYVLISSIEISELYVYSLGILHSCTKFVIVSLMLIVLSTSLWLTIEEMDVHRQSFVHL